jgi:ribosomal protein S18 acetylase RimI-like enzyme
MVGNVEQTKPCNYRSVAQMLGRAFRDHPLVLSIFRGLPGEERIKRTAIAFAGDLSVCVNKGYPLHIVKNGNIGAAAVIYPPGAYPLSMVDNLLMFAKVIWGCGFFGLGRWLEWLSYAEKKHPKQPHYYLEYIGVEPALQRKGLGSEILKCLTEKADTAQVGCYLESTNIINVPLYQRFGFRIAEEGHIISVQFYLMWRTPNASGT